MAPHRILMLGGRRSGKSSILSCVLYALQQAEIDVKNITKYDCKISDETKYDEQMIETPNGLEKLPKLRNKRRETHGYILNHKDMGSNIFTVDMTPTNGKGTYSLEITLNTDSKILFDFVDVPGEWMVEDSTDHKHLIEEIKKSDVFIIAIDTPFLMQESEDITTQEIYDNINIIYNRIEEITDSLKHIQFGGADFGTKEFVTEDKKLILLCPVKCEKWVLSGKADLVTKKVKAAYDRLLTHLEDKPNVEIKIMPIQTAGGLESAKMLPAKLLYRTEDTKTGESCSEDPFTGMILLRDGISIRPKEQYVLLPDKKWKIDHFDIPLSWYKVNGRSFKPMFCEQPAYHIMEFLLSKEEQVIQTKAEIEAGRLREMNFFSRFFKTLFNPTFGQYLPKFKGLISALNENGFIKRNGDGFEVVNKNSSNNIHS